MSLQINLPLVNCEYIFEESLEPTAALKINGAIVNHNNKYFCAYRTDHLFGYDARNYITELDKNFNPISHKLLIAENGNSAFEDIRLFSYNGKMIAIYTYLPKIDENKWDWCYGVALAEVDLEGGFIRRQQSLRSLSSNLHEKNWIPYLHEGSLFLISNFIPDLRIFKVIDSDDGFLFSECHNEPLNIHQWNFGNIRGGTPFIKNSAKKDNWQYAFVHSHLKVPNGNDQVRYYFYTLLRFDPYNKKVQYLDYPLGYSKNDIWNTGLKPTILNSKGINMSTKVVFPMGIVNHGDGVLISYGKDDVTTRLKFYTWNFIYVLFEIEGKIYSS